MSTSKIGAPPSVTFLPVTKKPSGSCTVGSGGGLLPMAMPVLLTPARRSPTGGAYSIA